MYYLYQIKNTVTDYKYIGCSKNLKKRWKEHRNNLNSNKHHCIHLQRAWNKYKEGSFVFEILKEFSTEDSMLLGEISLIETTSKKYNVAPGGIGGNLSRFRTEEQKLETSKKKSEASKKRYQRPGEREKCNTWKNLTEEERELKLKRWREVKLGRNNKSFKNTTPVQQIDRGTNEVIKIWDDSWSAGHYGGFNPSYIVKCCNNHPEYKTHKGFIWKWKLQ
jgi:group I intron endonuclease